MLSVAFLVPAVLPTQNSALVTSKGVEVVVYLTNIAVASGKLQKSRFKSPRELGETNQATHLAVREIFARDVDDT